MAACNYQIDLYSCTLETCCWEQGLMHYPPNLAGTTTYLVIFALFFVAQHITSLIIQAVGGALSASADTEEMRQKGVDSLIAGLTFQAASLLGFLGMTAWFIIKVRKGNTEERNPQFASLRATRYFQGFTWAIAVAALTIFIRCVYRVVELSDGFSGAIANDEPLFLALEGPMIMVAMLAVTVYHPGLVFRDQWQDADWHFQKSDLPFWGTAARMRSVNVKAEKLCSDSEESIQENQANANEP
ncbi:MAG: hypothetical protein Q9159_000468 [Coniocarpon cinnabarinum]